MILFLPIHCPICAQVHLLKYACILPSPQSPLGDFHLVHSNVICFISTYPNSHQNTYPPSSHQRLLRVYVNCQLICPINHDTRRLAHKLQEVNIFIPVFFIRILGAIKTLTFLLGFIVMGPLNNHFPSSGPPVSQPVSRGEKVWIDRDPFFGHIFNKQDVILSQVPHAF